MENVVLAQYPALVLKLEKYGIALPQKKGGAYEGAAKKWAKEKTPPYDDPQYQALAARLPTGWEELNSAEMEQLLQQLKDAIRSRKTMKLDLPNKGSEKMLKNLTKLAMTCFACAATVLDEAGTGILPDTDEGEKKRAHHFGVELILLLTFESGLLRTLLRGIVQTTGTNKNNETLMSEALTLLAQALILKAVAGKNEEKLLGMLPMFNSHLMHGIEKIEGFVNQSLIDETIKGEKAELLALQMQQAKMALQREDFDGLIATLNETLGLLDLSLEMLEQDIDSLRLYGKQLRNALTTGLEEETRQMAQVSQAM